MGVFEKLSDKGLCSCILVVWILRVQIEPFCWCNVTRPQLLFEVILLANFEPSCGYLRPSNFRYFFDFLSPILDAFFFTVIGRFQSIFERSRKTMLEGLPTGV